jgi:hypothetical protein
MNLAGAFGYKIKLVGRAMLTPDGSASLLWRRPLCR